MPYHTNYNGKFRHFGGGTPGALRHLPPCPRIRAVHALSVIAALAMSAGILLAAQSGCNGATPAGTDGSYDTPDMGPFEHAPVQAATEEGGMPNLTAACQIADTLADMLFTGVLDTAYAVHGVLSLTAADNVTADSTLKLDRASGIVTFESGGHTYAAVAAFHDHSVQILNITNPYNITAAGNITDTATYQYNDTLELIGASGIATFESGGHTYAAVTAYRDDSVQILNITDPFNITAADSITDTDTLELYTPYGIATFELDGHTYAAVTAYDDDGVQILNITDPFNIIATDSITDTDTLELRGARSLTTFNTGGYTYAAVAARSDDGVQILNITDPFNITAADSITDTDTLELRGARDITTFESGGYTYAAVTAYTDDGVQILNITNPYNITATDSITDAGTLELYAANGIAIFNAGSHIYAAVAASIDDGVQILDITDPSDITAAASITNGDNLRLDAPYGIATFESGGHTYVVVTTSLDNSVQIIRIDPAVPDTTISDTAPTVTSIERHNPSTATTDSPMLTYKVTFSEDVTGVGTADFALSSDSTGDTNGNNPVTSISGSGSVYYAEVSASTDGTYNLDLVSSGHGIADESSNPLTNTTPTGADETYTVSTTITQQTPQQLQASAVTLDPVGTPGPRDIGRITLTSATPGTIVATWVAPGEAPANYRISWAKAGESYLTWTDSSGNAFPTDPAHTITGLEAGETYNVRVRASYSGTSGDWSGDVTITIAEAVTNTIVVPDTHIVTDTTAPTISSIERSNPSGATTESRTLVYRITFSENVTGVGTADFALSSDSTGDTNGNNPVTSISGSGSVYYAEVSASTDGTYNLDLVSSGHGIADESSNPLTNTTPTGADETYTVSTTITQQTPQQLQASAVTLDPVGTPGPRDIGRITLTSAAPGTIEASWVAPGEAPANYRISWAKAGESYLTWTDSSGNAFPTDPAHTITGLEAGETYNVRVRASYSGTSGDWSGDVTITIAEAVTNTIVVPDTHIVTDTTAPTISSIERSNPSGATTESRTLTYKVTFSENVTGVGTADFALSPGSTGGTSTSSGQFTQTRSPSLAIPDNTTVSDAITVADSGTATSVTVAVDITHTYIGDLRIDLVAPDGTTKTLHNRLGGSIDDINQEYTPDFEGESIAGTWSLRISDNANFDSGTLNDWTLTINHGSSTASPVTSISGSSDTYYVTVSATTDGTYNLDLVSSRHGIADESSNPLTSTTPTGADETYTVSTVVTDTTAPTISSITRYNPSTATTDSQTLTYKVTFSEDVTGVGTADFALSSGSTGTGSITGLTGSGNTYHVTVSATTDGTYNLDLVSSGHDIADTASNPLTNTAPTGADETYTVSTVVTDTTAPTISSIERSNPSGATTESRTLVYRITFSEDVTGVGTADFALSSDSTGDTNGNNPVTSILGSGDTYYATVSATTDGTYNLDLVSSGHGIADTASNPLANTTPTGADETYTVSTTVVNTANPRLESIERLSPTSQNTNIQYLIYKATFSKSVTGVGASDFVLSPGSTGGGNNGNSPIAGISGSGDTYYVVVSPAVGGTYNLDLVSSDHNIADAASNPLTNTAPTGADETYTVSR